LRLALRSWRGKRWMAVLLVATLAVGVTGTVVVFSVADLVLWHPLPFRNADRLVSLWSYLPEQHLGAVGAPTSPAVLVSVIEAWDNRARFFSAVCAYAMGGFTMSGHGEPQAVTGCRVSLGLFDGLGVRPSVGRDFVADDFQSGADHAVLLSDHEWKSR